MIRRTAIFVISALICSCATAPSPREQAQIEATRPTCQGEKDCAAKWETAQLYVIKHTDYKLEIATNVLIETFDSRDKGMAMSVTKEPLGGGQYKLVARAWCDSILGCYQPPVDVVLGFNQQVAASPP